MSSVPADPADPSITSSDATPSHPPDADAIASLPFSADSEAAHLYSTLGSYHLYRRTAHANLAHSRRKTFYSLPQSQQDLLSFYPDALDAIDEAIDANADLADQIFVHSLDAFGVDTELLEGKEWLSLVTPADLDKVRSTLKQFYRDWSEEGRKEREICYGPVKSEVERRHGHLSEEEKAQVSILVPGCGLGRLPFDLAVMGYAACGNENSFHQLMASNYILNCTKAAHQHRLHPWISSFSNHRSRANHLRAVTIPEILPSSLLVSREGQNFGMAAGDFVGSYNTPDAKETFDVVATVFFIDTAINFIEYVEAIWNVLKEGGCWINYGPLLWHWENREPPKGEMPGVELTAEEVRGVVEKSGFTIVERRDGEPGEYIGSGGRSMLDWVYKGEFWVAEKR